jgi:hypothetical protein
MKRFHRIEENAIEPRSGEEREAAHARLHQRWPGVRGTLRERKKNDRRLGKMFRQHYLPGVAPCSS